MQANRWPQPYEVSQPELEYSYATHAVDVTTYDNVPHDENGGCDCNTKKRVHVIDNSPLYSLCDEETSEDETYTKMDWNWWLYASMFLKIHIIIKLPLLVYRKQYF